MSHKTNSKQMSEEQKHNVDNSLIYSSHTARVGNRCLGIHQINEEREKQKNIYSIELIIILLHI